MARVLVQVSEQARAGEAIQIQTLIAHPMETGLRPGADGRLLPQDIIRRFSCRYNGELVFSADLFASVAANPYLAFQVMATVSGQLILTWEGDHGFVQTESVGITVSR